MTMLKGKYYYAYTDSKGNARGIYADSKYEALYNASCLCGELIPSTAMWKEDPVTAEIAVWMSPDCSKRALQRLHPTVATLANARHKINAMA